MAEINEIKSTDIVKNSRADINSNFNALNSDKAEKTDIQKSTHTYAEDTGSANAYEVTLTPAPTAYTTGMKVTFKAANTNTGASTLNVNSLGAKTIKKLVNQDLEGGEIVQNAIVTVVYDGTYFQLETLSYNVVLTTGNQTIGGTKTFSAIPVLPNSDPTGANEATRKEYVDKSWRLIQSGTFTASFNITDLDGDTDELYMLVLDMRNGSTFLSYFRFNSDANANYKWGGIGGGLYGGTANYGADGSSSETYIPLGWAYGTGKYTENGIYIMYLSVKSGYARVVQSFGAIFRPTDVIYEQGSIVGVWTNTTDNITTINVKIRNVGDSAEATISSGKWWLYAKSI